MNCFVVCPIVEGHGEVEALRTLLSRLWWEIDRDDAAPHLEVLQPIRQARGTLRSDDGLARALSLAEMKISARTSAADHATVLVLLDAEEECPVEVARHIRTVATRHVPHLDVAVVIPNVMYETWFVAAAASLSEHLDLGDDEPPSDAEAKRLGKGWIKRHIRAPSYKETVDQPKLTAAMDLNICRAGSRSFDKLCREMLRRRAAATSGSSGEGP